jgi:DNA polymerase elongation subunit (family B)
MARILILDIETSPNVAYVWKFFKENVGAKQVLENGQMLSFAAKWLDDDKIYYHDVQHSTELQMMKMLFEMLDEADIVVAHNGDKFDLPHVQGRGLVLGLKPPAPYKTIDTVRVARYEFNFPSNSLEYLSIVLDLKNKKDGHKKFPGFELWLGVLANNPEAWAEMKEYNIQDILVLEELYLKMRPYMKRHPNVGVFDDKDIVVCPKCGSSDIHYRGYAHTNVGRYRRFQCNPCGGWGRHRTTIYPNDLKKNLVVNAVN